MNKAYALCGLAAVVLGSLRSATAQEPDVARIKNIESQLWQLRTEVGDLKTEINRLQLDVKNLAGPGVALWLFGVVCALWAQNRRRNAWLWFFLGFFLGVIAGIMMLYRNYMDRLSDDIAKTAEALKRNMAEGAR